MGSKPLSRINSCDFSFPRSCGGWMDEEDGMDGMDG